MAEGLSRPALAERIGAKAGLVKSWETQGRQPTVSNLARVADALGLSVADLYQSHASTERALVDLRVSAGLSQRELAQRLQVTQSAVTRWESGRARPTWEEIARYAEAAGVTRTEVAAAIDATAAQHGNLPIRQRQLRPSDFHLTSASPHVIYEFEEARGHVTVTSPQFPRFVYRPKSPTPTMLELATICEHLEAPYRHRYNHLQHRCAGTGPDEAAYLIRWLSAAHDTSPGAPSARTRCADSLGLSVPLWRSGQLPGPQDSLTTGEYLIIVVEPDDTAEFLRNQIRPDEEVTFYPTQLGDGLGPIAVTRGGHSGGILRREVPPETTYRELCQRFSDMTASVASTTAADAPGHADDRSDILEPFSLASPYDPRPSGGD